MKRFLKIRKIIIKESHLGLVKNALVFKTIYEQKKYELKKIKLILFYDAIHKYNYENDLQNVMNEV